MKFHQGNKKWKGISGLRNAIDRATAVEQCCCPQAGSLSYPIKLENRSQGSTGEGIEEDSERGIIGLLL